MVTIKGYYEGGHIFFNEVPPRMSKKTNVLITFLREDKTVKRSPRTKKEFAEKLAESFKEDINDYFPESNPDVTIPVNAALRAKVKGKIKTIKKFTPKISFD